MVRYGIWWELQSESLCYEERDLPGIKHSEFLHMTLDPLSKHIKKISTDYLQRNSQNAGMTGLVLCALMGSVALIFSLWHIRHPCHCVKILATHQVISQGN